MMVTAGVALVGSWLGASFACSAEGSLEPAESGPLVAPDHPDSHRRGVVVEERSPLPEWDRGAAGAGLLVLAE